MEKTSDNSYQSSWASLPFSYCRSAINIKYHSPQYLYHFSQLYQILSMYFSNMFKIY